MDLSRHVIDDLPEYSLGVLDGTETLRVERHLALCEDCRMEQFAIQQAANSLALSVPMTEPPAGLKSSIMEAAAAEPKASRADVSTRPQSKTAGSFSRIPAWGFLSLALILLLGAANLFLWNQLRGVNRALQSTLQVVTLDGTDFKPDATGLMIVGGEGNVGALIVDRLPVLDDAYEYQLWMIGEGGRVNGGVFNVSEDGYGVKYVHSPDPLLSYDSFGITIEPVGGSPSPTGEKVLGVDF